MKLSYTMRHEQQGGLPPVQPCCGKRHPLPWQHRHYYVDGRGRSKYDLECAICYKTLPERGLKPANIRWPKKRVDAYCETCTAELKARRDTDRETGDPFERVTQGLPLWARGS